MDMVLVWYEFGFILGQIEKGVGGGFLIFREGVWELVVGVACAVLSMICSHLLHGAGLVVLGCWLFGRFGRFGILELLKNYYVKILSKTLVQHLQ